MNALKLAKVQKKLRELAFDALVLTGAAIFAYGLWLAWHPLGFIVGGLMLGAAGIFFGYDREALRRRS
jgi:hypothetical protein